MTLHLYDGINIVRRELEVDPSGRPVRRLFTNMHAMRNGDVAVWVWDGYGAKKHRQSIYPRYKATRKAQPDLVWKTIQLFQDLLKHSPVLQISVPEYEADDVIAHYAHGDVLIHSTDRDFNALLTREGVKGTFNPLMDIEPRWVRLFKTCVGDTSDNVMGVKGFGRTTWSLLQAHGQLPELERIILKGDSPEALSEIPVRARNWINENRGELLAAWQIVGFLDMRGINLSDYTTTGVRNFEAGNALMKEFLL